MTGDPLSAPAVGVRAHGWGWQHAGRHEWALRELDLTIEAGERVLLLGPSGSGKSTLLRALAGVLADDEGQAEGRLLLDGAHPRDARGRAGLLMQDPDSHLVLARLGDDIAFGCENVGVPRDEIWRRVPQALADVGLSLPQEQPTSRMSGGQKQRAALAGILAMRPGLLLLDEPTANLDPDGVVQVRDSVAELCERHEPTLIVVEHRIEPWLPVVDRLIVLDRDGGVLADGPAHWVLEAYRDRLISAGVWVPQWRPQSPIQPPVASETLLEAREVSVSRGSHVVLSGVSTRVAAGRVTAITGPNGVGKSTLSLALGGLAKPASGQIEAAPALARGARGGPHAWRSRDLLTRIGTVFQDPEHQFLTGRVREELLVGPRTLAKKGGSAPGVDVDELLVRFRLDALADANPFTLSGGEKRRLSVATALATAPQVLVLDEPTFGQDLATWQEMINILAALRAQGCAIVAVSHDELLVDILADQTLSIPAGVRAAA